MVHLVLIATIALDASLPNFAVASLVGDSYAVLDRGQKAGYQWRIFASPMNHSRAQSLPCIDVSAERKLRPISEASVLESCGAIKPFPVVTQVVLGKGMKKVTIAGMAFDREVRTVKVPLSDGRAVWRRPRIISSDAARKARVEPFAFLSFAVARGLSIGRVVGYDALGSAVTGLPR